MPLKGIQMRSPVRYRLSVKSRIGYKSKHRKAGIQSRLGKTVITDARQKIILSRTQSGRVGRLSDAREKIDARRMTGTTNSPPGELFRSAVSGMRQWANSIPRTDQTDHSLHAPMLTRTISNPLARSNPQFLRTRGLSSSFLGTSVTSVAKVAPSFSLNSGRFNRRYGEDVMDVDKQPVPISSSMQSRLDSPKFKVKISNLQPSVTLDDIVELFSDVGDLVTAKITTPGNAESYYKTKADCLKAVDAYHNRLLDGSPMKVSFDGEIFAAMTAKATVSTPLKSASGATIKLPKSSSTVKIHPDLSAIHKVLFQPSSSSNATKMLFKGVGQ